MSRIPRIAAVALLAAVVFGGAANAQTVLVGATSGGAFYTIAVPDLGQLQALQLVEGYAVAASSYQQVGWAVFKTDADLIQLVDERRPR